ncbi:MAG TPA: glycosyltransferase family 4 protein [Rhodanobacteraceae bacterium]|nr:glycosyltransferase family 4 protein [Rhodanobacteraceae bacterium]
MGVEAAIPLTAHAPRFDEHPLRVLMTADTIGGVWQYALDLSRALIARGVRVTLATMGGLPDRDQRRQAAEIPALDLRASHYKLCWMEDPWDDVHAAGDWLLSLAHEVQPDVVHLNDLGHGDLPWRAPVLTVGHSCVLSWWRAVHGEPAPEPQWTRYRRRVAAGLHASQMVIAPTQAMLSSLQEFYGPLRNTRVIANGRNARIEARAKRNFIFAAGRVWDEGKNLRALAEVAARVPWPVCIAGSAHAPHRDSEQERTGFLNVHRLGELGPDAMRRWFAKASIYALPAHYEPFGLSVLEAAQAGCALVLGDIESLRETWDGAALFVSPDDRDALVDALQRLITEDALRTRGMARAHRRATHLTPQAMADAYLESYEELSTRRAARSYGYEARA